MSNIKGIYSPITKKRTIDNNFTFNDYECNVKWRVVKQLIFCNNKKIIFKQVEHSYLIEYIDTNINKTSIKFVPLEDVLYEDTLDFLNIQVYDIVKEINVTENNINTSTVRINNKKYYIQNEQLLKSIPRYINEEKKKDDTKSNIDVSSIENHNNMSSLILKDKITIQDSNIKDITLPIIDV
jgi:hypothetical protein